MTKIIFTLICAVALISMVSAEEWINMKDRLKGLVIHFESRRPEHEKNWVIKSGYHPADDDWRYYTRVNQYSDDTILSEEMGKWLVKDCGGEYVCFACAMDEGGQQKVLDRQLAAGYPYDSPERMALLTEDFSPELHDAPQHILECDSMEMTNCRVQSKRWPGFFWQLGWRDGIPNGPDTYYILYGEGFLESSRIRIYAPEPSDYYEVIYDATNQGSEATAPYKSETTVGMSSTTSESHTVSSSTTMEASASFAKFGAGVGVEQTVSSSWTTSSEQTFWVQVTKTLTFVTQARTRLTVKQLKGKYGIFGISSESYIYEEVDLDNPTKSYKSPVMKMDRDMNTLDVTSHRKPTKGAKKEL